MSLSSIPRRYRILAIVMPAVLIVDFLTKLKVHMSFAVGESIAVIPGFFALTYVRNPGAAFSLLASAPAWFREPFFFVVPLTAIVLLTTGMRRLDDRQTIPAIALSLVAAGALGNLFDRLRYGYVIDFLDFHWRDYYHWPRFNVADCAIVVGVAFLLFRRSPEPVKRDLEARS